MEVPLPVLFCSTPPPGILPLPFCHSGLPATTAITTCDTYGIRSRFCSAFTTVTYGVHYLLPFYLGGDYSLRCSTARMQAPLPCRCCLPYLHRLESGSVTGTILGPLPPLPFWVHSTTGEFCLEVDYLGAAAVYLPAVTVTVDRILPGPGTPACHRVSPPPATTCLPLTACGTHLLNYLPPFYHWVHHSSARLPPGSYSAILRFRLPIPADFLQPFCRSPPGLPPGWDAPHYTCCSACLPPPGEQTCTPACILQITGCF